MKEQAAKPHNIPPLSSRHPADSVPARASRSEGMVEHHIDESKDDRSINRIEVASKGHSLIHILKMAGLHRLARAGYLRAPDRAVRHEAGESA